ncbi:MAG: hypothetical protein K9G76_10460 [Bacteroidales bacterium]|nr:hypothetical protein [Bacteroidales bacterium]MCF8405776.1 hypothetical protein [Bacteroidales bacterium]
MLVQEAWLGHLRHLGMDMKCTFVKVRSRDATDNEGGLKEVGATRYYCKARASSSRQQGEITLENL